jgi:2-C-methyl-D-erythritol 2,4-cyclodiphosphate synthase
LGGVKIPCEKGLLGHSDADVLIHAIIDSLFGAAALGDIGKHFPDSDEKYKGVSSIALLKLCADEILACGFSVINIDTTIVAQEPKLQPYIDEMRQNIAKTLRIDISRVSVKAKTEEKLGFTGHGLGMSAYSVALID